MKINVFGRLTSTTPTRRYSTELLN